MLKINNPDAGIPGRYTFTVPETGYNVGPFNRLKELLEATREHYSANNIPIPENLDDIVQDLLCRKIPFDLCTSSSAQVQRAHRADLSAETILKGITSLSAMAFSAAKGEQVFVDQDTATARAEICARCVFNAPSSFCAGCGIGQTITNTVAKVKGGRSTPFDNRLLNCVICGCKNEAIVHVNRNILLKGEKSETTESRPDWCWLKTVDIEQAKENLHL